MPAGIVTRGTHADGAANVELHLTRGDSVSHTLYIVDDDGDVVTLYGCSAKLVISSAWDGAAVLTFDSAGIPATITITEAAGTLLLEQSQATMEGTGIVVGDYVWSLWITDGNGVRLTYARGLCYIHPRVAD